VKGGRVGAPLPWFPFFINDWQFDEAVRYLSWEERGIYLDLLCWQWREGSIPSSANRIRESVHAPIKSIRKVLTRCFTDDGEEVGRAVNPKLAELRIKQLQKAGKSSAASRGWKTTEERYLYAASATQDVRGKLTPVIKIGWSRNPRGRIRAIGREARMSLTLLGTRVATISLERRAHVELGGFNLQGEWFRDTPEVRAWLETNGVSGNTSGTEGGNTSGIPSGENHGVTDGTTAGRSRIRDRIRESLSSAGSQQSPHPNVEKPGE
jgi:uncharacterized protein YdaU (DUF1376 family)